MWTNISFKHCPLIYRKNFSGGSVVNNPPARVQDAGSILKSGRSLGERMATHSSILVWGKLMDERSWVATIIKELGMI